MDNDKHIVDWENVDAICCVVTKIRTKESVLSVLDRYIKNRIPLNADDYDLDTGEIDLKNEIEMINWLAENKAVEQLVFWNESDNQGYMIGANFTSDGMIVFSLTTKADGKTGFELLEDIKKHVDSQYGMVNYNAYPGYDDGAGFIEICRNTEQYNS